MTSATIENMPTRKQTPEGANPFASRLVALREERGWTEEQLEERSGVARQTISRLERGLTVPRAKTLKGLADAFQISVADLKGVQHVSNFEKSVPHGSMPPGLDVWLKARGYDASKRLQDELQAVRLEFTKPPPPDTDWIKFWDKVAEAFVVVHGSCLWSTH